MSIYMLNPEGECEVVLNGKYLATVEGHRCITISSLDAFITNIYNDMMDRQRYESRWIKKNGEVEVTDVGYASDGAFFFLEELKSYIGGQDEEGNSNISNSDCASSDRL